MIRSIALHNFVHFNQEQRLVFAEGTNFIIGGNSTGKTAVFELIRRCYSNNINTSTTSVLNKNELAYAVCHFTIPERYPAIDSHCIQQPKEILACIFVKNRRNENANEFAYYKVISSTSNGHSFQTFVQKCIGLYDCSTEERVQSGCKEVTLEKSVVEKLIDSDTKNDVKVEENGRKKDEKVQNDSSETDEQVTERVSKKDEKVQDSHSETDGKVKDRGRQNDEKVENCVSTKDDKEKNSACTNDGRSMVVAAQKLKR